MKYPKEKFEPGVVGRNIKFYRKLRGMSQIELSRKADIAQSHLSGIERGRSQDLHFTTGCRIAAILKIRPEYLLEEWGGDQTDSETGN